MYVPNKNVVEELRTQMFMRINNRRSELIMQRRLQGKPVNMAPESKLKMGYSLQQEAEQLMQQMERPEEMTVEMWNETYEEIQRELNEHLAKQLCQIQDDQGNYELNERTSHMEAEQLAETYFGGHSTAVCSVCK